MYQIQALDEPGALAALAATDYPLLVLEPGHNFADSPYDTQAMVNALRNRPSGEQRLLLAYVDIGQAEDYRDYWGRDWVAPTDSSPGHPDFLVSPDPDGWSGNYPVAYWWDEWKALWLGGVRSLHQFAYLGIRLFSFAKVHIAGASNKVRIGASSSHQGTNCFLVTSRYVICNGGR